MNEEIKNRAVELTDDDIGNVTGGMAPDGYSPCAVRYDYDYGSTFCGTICKYLSTKDCMMSYCKDTLINEVEDTYHKWLETY